jgi:paraquat-inducible protein A
VALTTLVAPMVKLCALVYVLAGARLRRPPRHLRTVFRWIEHLGPWSMIEVYLLGVFVAYTKLVDMAQVHVGMALFAFAGVMIAMTAADSALDPEAVWQAIDRRSPSETQAARAVERPAPGAVGCHCCGLVSGIDRHAPAHCPRCGSALHARKPNSIARTWALLLAAAILYVPANLYPVMTVISLGQGTPDTILSGVEELAHAGMWPLALLVFFASITVPVLKLIGLTVMLVSTQTRSHRRLRDRTVLYRIIEFVGRWSMIDVFMLSILVGLVQLGNLATIEPGIGAVSFASVVILTMLAAESFDPRLMWDAVETSKRSEP